ncbi:hypothetical protein J4731_09135 [Providencia rettgeri]|nr:hypothetical protein [Providencia rettgeri]
MNNKLKYSFALALMSIGTVAMANAPTAQPYNYRVAFMPDIHFHDVYGQFADNAFEGLKIVKVVKMPLFVLCMHN